jgi:UDP-N-acetylglucosamine 4,6-dehydratase
MERVLVTGGTGFLGSHIVKELLRRGHEVVSFARGEHKHEEQARLAASDLLSSHIGDVRDLDAVESAAEGCQSVIHCAAQKCVPWAEAFPEEAIKTNVQGTINVAKAAEAVGARAVLVSTDKACKPINTYGASKYLAERVWHGPIVRMGNIWGSTGSVIYWLLKQRGTGTIKITSSKMRRFHIRVEQAVAHILSAVHDLSIPTMKWYWLDDLAEAVDPNANIVETGIRQGEKLEEDLYESKTLYPEYLRLTVDELRREVDLLCGSGETADTRK